MKLIHKYKKMGKEVEFYVALDRILNFAQTRQRNVEYTIDKINPFTDEFNMMLYTEILEFLSEAGIINQTKNGNWTILE